MARLFGIWVTLMGTIFIGGVFTALASPIWTDALYTGVPVWAAVAFAVLTGPPIVALLVAIWRDVLDL